MKIRYQVGAESHVDGRRVARLTGPDQTSTIDDTFGMLILMGQQAADAEDSQPGDGEIDFKIKDVTPELVAKFPLLKKVNLMPGEQNLFLRLRAV